MAKKKTHKEFIEEMNNVDENIEILSEYVNCRTKVQCRCKTCGNEWLSTPTNLLKPRGCSLCANKKQGDMKRKTHEEFIKEIKSKYDKIIALSKYKGYEIKVKFKCLECGYEWFTTPNTLLNSIYGCPECAKVKNGENRNLTHEEFMEKVTSRDYIVLDKYINARTKIKVKCKRCGNTKKVYPSILINGHGCKICAGLEKKTTDSFKKELKTVNRDIEILSEYKGSKEEIRAKCKKCNYAWNTNPSKLLIGCGCPKCAGNLKKTTDIFTEEMKEINKSIIVIGKYKGAFENIRVKCKDCGYTWLATPSNLLKGQKCIKCNLESKGEKMISNILDEYSIPYFKEHRFEDCKSKRTLPFDFYLPKDRVAIEYDGEQHYKPIELFGGEKEFIKRKKHDNIKNKYCATNNITLIRVPYYLDDKEGYILNKLGIS